MLNHPPVKEPNRKVHWKDKDLSTQTAAWSRVTQANGPRHSCPPSDVDFIQLSKIRGAANGKVETSRGRKKFGASVRERCRSVAAYSEWSESP